MEHSLGSSAPTARKRFVWHLRAALAVAVVLVSFGAACANALADEQAPLSGQITSPLSTIAAPAPVPNRYLVTFVPGASGAEQGAALADAGATDISTIPALRMHVVDASEAAVSSLGANPTVQGVEADQVRNVQGAPSDPSYSAQWSLSRIGWDQAFGSVNPTGSATVAILDTGVDSSHPDLAGQLVAGTSIIDPSSDGTTDPNGHGTWMAGIVAAATDNGTGIAGVGYAGVKVMPVAVLGADGTGSDGNIISGVIYAADHGANVILMSFTNPGFSQSLQDAIDYAWSKGAVVVAAAGNDESATVNYPAGDRGVVGVANSDASDALNPTSNYGQDVFMAAPGTNIDTTSLGGGYATISGTSAAAAEVAGAAALMKATAPDVSNGVIVGRLGADAEALSAGQPAGNGRLNLARALTDSSTASIEPAGAAPIGEGGPVVGPYQIAAKSLEIAFAGTGGGAVALSDTTESKNSVTCEKTCGASVGNSDEGALTASPAANATFSGWSTQSAGVTACTASAAEGTCKFAMTNSAQKVTATFNKVAADGSGSIAVAPTTVVAGSGANTLTFTYMAAAGGLHNGAVQLTAPAGWSAPSTTSASKGFTTSTTGTVAVSGQTITVSGVSLAGGATVAVVYGDKTKGGAGADAPGAGASGASTFSTSEKSASAGALTARAPPPPVTGTQPANGSGSAVVSPSAAIAASGGNTLTFSYTAVAGGLNNGTVQLTAPAGWSGPSTTSGTKGYTTSSAGTVGVSGQTVTVSGLTLAANATVTITYGDKTGGGAGAEAPGAGTSTFAASEKSTSGGTLTALASSPSVQLTSPSTSIGFPGNNAAYNAAGWAAGCATAGICGTASDTGSTVSGVQVSVKRNSDSSYWNGTSFVAGTETYLAASGSTSWSLALNASALSDGVGYTIHAKSTDGVGNVSTVAGATFIYDTTAPSTTVSSPANNAFINNPTPTISGAAGSAAGDNSTATVKIYSGPNTSGSLAQTFNSVAITSGSWSVKAASLTPGTYTAQVTQGDSAGNSGSSTSTFTLDTSAPVTTDDVPAAFVDHNVTVTLSAGDTGGSGVEKTFYTTDGSAPSTASLVYNPSSKPVLTSDGQTIKYFSTDKAGNEETVHTATVHIDTLAPATTDNVPSAFVNHDVTVTLTASDTGGSGLEKTFYTTDGSEPSTSSHVYDAENKPVLTGDGQSIKYFSTDKAGNVETAHTASARIDTQAPTTSAAGENADSTAYSAGDWTHQAVTVALSATDAPQLGSATSSGVQHTFYKVDSAASYSTGSSVTISAPGDHSSDGIHTIHFYAIDNAGNTETAQSFTVKIDTQAPASGATSAQLDDTGTITVDAHAADASPSSGVSSVELFVKAPGATSFTLAHTNSDGSSTFSYTVPLDENSKPVNGNYSFYTVAHDTAGNSETAKTSAETTTLEDTVAPTSGATSAQLDNTGTIAVDAHAADASPSSGVSSVELFVKKPGDSTFALAHTNSDGSSTFSYTVPLDENSKPVNGSYSFYTIAHDTAGNAEAAKTSAESSTLVDTVKPGSQASAPATNRSASIDVAYSSGDHSPSSGVASVELWVKAPGGSGYTRTATDSTPGASGSFTYTVPTSEEATVDGTYSFYTISTDKAGNRESVPGAPDATTTESNTIQDTQAPSTSAAAANADASVYDSGTWTNQPVTLTLSATDTPQTGADASSGVEHTFYKVDSAASYSTGTSVTVDAPGDHSNDGTHTISYYSTDKAGNTETTHTFTIKTDTTAPTSGATSAQLDNTGTIAVDAHATDASPSSGVSSVELFVKKPGDSTFTLAHTNSDGSSTFNYTVPLDESKQPVNGSYSFYTIAHDTAGNNETSKTSAETTTLEDTVAPTTTDNAPAAFVNHDVPVTLSASDTGGSGVAETFYTTDGSAPSTASSVYNPASKPVLTSDGQSIKYFSTDNAGNEETVHTASAHIDRAAPTTTDDVPATFVNHDVTVTLSGADTGGSGVGETFYTTDGSAPSTASSVYNPASKPVLTSDGQSIRYFSTDNAGNEESVHAASAHIDRAAPTTTDDVPSSFANHDVTVTLTATDTGGSGLDKTYYTTDGSAPSTASHVYDAENKPALTEDGQSIRYFSTDNAGNKETVHTASAKIDRAAPTTTDDVPATFVNHDVTVTLSGADTGGSGLEKTYYTTDGSAPSTGSHVYDAENKPVLTSDGQSIKYFSTDKAGNEESTHTATAHIDTLAPTTTAAGENADNSAYAAGSWTNQAVTVKLDAADAPQLGSTASSGVEHTFYKLDSAASYSTATSVTIPAPGDHSNDGTHTISYYSTDNAGNTETTHTFTIKTDTTAPTSGATSAQLDNTGTIAVDAHATDASPSSGVSSVELFVKKPGDSSFALAHTNTDGSSTFHYTVPLDENEKPVNGSYSFYTLAHDTAGNNETAKASAETSTLEDTVAPSTTDNVPTGFVNHDVTVTLTAADTGGSGVEETYYTTDGTAPSKSSHVYNPESRPVLTEDGQSIKYLSVDRAGNEESAHSATAHIDRSAPSTTDNVPNSYVNHDVTVTLSASDAGGSGLEGTRYTIDGSAPTSSSPVYDASSKPVLTTDGQTIRYFSTDKAGNAEGPHSATAHIDRSAPTTTDNVPSAQVTSSITVTLTASDTGGSGVATTYYTTDGSEPSTSSPVYNAASKPVLTSDGQRITYFSTDSAGNAEAPHSATAHIQTDSTPPTTSDNVDASWHSSPLSVTLTATDNAGGSGVKTTSFKVYGGSAVPAKTDSGWQTYNPSNKPALNNGQAIAYYSVDNAGNQESVGHSAPAKVDALAGVQSGATYTLGSVPTVTCIDPSATVSFSAKVGQVTATCTDGGGTVGVTYSVAYCATSLTSPVSGSWVSSAGTCTTPQPNIPVYNVAKAGSSVPVKFSLHGNQGLAIFAPGYPLSQQVLATGTYTDSSITVTTNASGLQYDASSDQYTYVWNTNKAWSGESRQLVIELNDGVTYIRANFNLK